MKSDDKKEFSNLKFQIETSSWNNYGSIRKYLFNSFTKKSKMRLLYYCFLQQYVFKQGNFI